MELLYIWVNHSEDEQIIQEGFNFSPEYNFLIEISENTFLIKNDTEWNGKPSVFKSHTISNVTAIVGKNGSGKTSLLDYIFHADAIKFTPRGTTEYARLDVYEQSIYECVLIYEVNGAPKIYHNLIDYTVISTDEYQIVDMNTDVYNDVMEDPNGYANMFKIYLSNSNYTRERFSSRMSLNQTKMVSLIPETILSLCRMYYEKVVDMEALSGLPVSLKRQWLESVIAYKKTDDFQAVCDLLYFYQLHENGREESYLSKVNSSVIISVIDPGKLILSTHREFHNYDRGREVPVEYRRLYQLMTRLRDINWSRGFMDNLIINVLNLYLVIEWVLYHDLGFPFDVITAEAVNCWIETHSEEMSEDEYFSRAISEINTLKEILTNADDVQNYVSEGDLAYRREKVIHRESLETYLQFLSLIDHLFHQQKSFILRYLTISSPEMSSGERAFQNFFSWINLLPKFNMIDSAIVNEIPNHIMLLIDEIDLYMHPEWQQKYMKAMLEELENQFSDRSLQVVFATHSPLCLSDIPKENCIYLYRTDRLHVKSRKDMKQTFGRDIYTLLADAFYLDDITMGSFARDYIQELFAEIDHLSADVQNVSCDDVVRLQKKIDYIGNDIISFKLRQMLDSATRSNSQLRIDLLRAELMDLEQQV